MGLAALVQIKVLESCGASSSVVIVAARHHNRSVLIPVAWVPARLHK